MSEEPTIYAVRFSREAEQNATGAAHDRLNFDGDADAARALLRSFYSEAAKLQTFPQGFPRAEHESREIGLPLRRRNVGSWAMYFTIEEAGDDGPTVSIVFLWPGAAMPITSDVAERIKSNQ